MRAPAALLVLLAPLALAAAPAAEGARCGDVPGLGPACEVEGGYEIELDDGTRLFTHGPDAVPSAALLSLGGAPPRAPPCVDDPSRDYHGHLVYAHPIDKPDRGAELAPALRELVAEANGLLYDEGARLGAPVEYRFRCDADGLPTLSIVTIPLPTGQGSYSALANALRAMGFTDGHAKYWVWYDDPTACPCGGMAAAPLDPDRSPANSANSGPHIGVTFGYLSSLILMHENGHNLGLVNNAAPGSSGAAHCNDGLDIMCYADGGPTSSYTRSACPDRVRFDCGHDAYFHPMPPPGAYVATRWQLAAPVDRFVQGCLYAEDDILLSAQTPAAALAPHLATKRVDVPAGCQGHRYAIYGRMVAEPTHAATGQPALRLSVNVFGLCWFAGEAPLGCPAQKPWGHEGLVPAGATHAIVTRASGENARFTLSVV